MVVSTGEMRIVVATGEMITYLHAAQQAPQDKRGLFTHPDEAHLLLLPWKFRSGIVNTNSHVLNREHSIAVSVDKLTYACRKVNSTTDSVCCIKHMKTYEGFKR